MPGTENGPVKEFEDDGEKGVTEFKCNEEEIEKVASASEKEAMEEVAVRDPGAKSQEECCFDCKYCGKSFKSHNYVKIHERWHKGELQHKCNESISKMMMTVMLRNLTLPQICFKRSPFKEKRKF